MLDHDTGKVVWAAKGKTAETLCTFFDRFHVQQLSSDAVDEVRRGQHRELRDAGDTEEAKVIKGTRFALLKNPWNLTRDEGKQLRDVQDNNARLFRAYLLNQTLASALDYLQPKRARRALDAWLSWACRSKLAPFVRVSRTIRAKKEGVLAYIQGRLTNGIVEGTNNRLRMIARRAFGFHSADALISMLYLCCGGIELHPPLPQRHFDFRNPRPWTSIGGALLSCFRCARSDIRACVLSGT